MTGNEITIGCQTGCQPALYIITAIALLTFGIMYNYTVAWLENNGYTEGYTAFLVVIGVTFTLLFTLPIIGLTTFAILAFAFISSGLPMIIGAIWRHVRARQRAQIEWAALWEADADQDAQELA